MDEIEAWKIVAEKNDRKAHGDIQYYGLAHVLSYTLHMYFVHGFTYQYQQKELDSILRTWFVGDAQEKELMNLLYELSEHYLIPQHYKNRYIYLLAKDIIYNKIADIRRTEGFARFEEKARYGHLLSPGGHFKISHDYGFFILYRLNPASDDKEIQRNESLINLATWMSDQTEDFHMESGENPLVQWS